MKLSPHFNVVQLTICVELFFVLAGNHRYSLVRTHVINVIMKQKLLLPAKPTKCTGFQEQAGCCAVWWLYSLCIYESQQHVCSCRDLCSSLTADDLSSCHCEVAHILWENLEKAKLRMSTVTQVQ